VTHIYIEMQRRRRDPYPCGSPHLQVSVTSIRDQCAQVTDALHTACNSIRTVSLKFGFNDRKSTASYGVIVFNPDDMVFSVDTLK